MELRFETEVSSLRAAISGGSSPLLMGVQAIANDMTARTNNLLTLATANSVGLASIETTVTAASAAMTLQGQQIQTAVTAQGAQIEANVAAQADEIAADTSTQLAAYGPVLAFESVYDTFEILADLSSSGCRAAPPILWACSNLRRCRPDPPG